MGDIASVMGSLDADSKKYKTKLLDMMSMMKWNSFPASISDKVMLYLEYDYKRTECISEHQVSGRVKETVA